ncbi:hypothetical protein SDC9_105434 [bioreactor metagenome]|uniref:Uncharacterized protein n=1 Tax=bioreactor metagenome TaxID=1076179 RepID=A0A645B634_9ZZZZ
MRNSVNGAIRADKAVLANRNQSFIESYKIKVYDSVIAYFKVAQVNVHRRINNHLITQLFKEFF